MNRQTFVGKRQEAWRRFEILLDQFERTSRATKVAKQAAEFSRLFREVCYDLSLVRSRDWGRGLESYLNDLVSRGHNLFYRAPPGRWSQFLRFLGSGFPRLFRRNFGYVAVSALLFYLPLAVAWAVVQHDPTLARRVIPPQQLEMFDQMYSESGPMGDSSNDPLGNDFGGARSIMFGFYVNHNVGIALQTFGSGILLGVGTVYTLLMNGISLGTISGYMISQGHSDRFLSFVVSHGSFELTAIVVAGAAGLMLGDALLHPGRRTRLEALHLRGIEATQMAGGAAAMLVVAAVIEAFWSPADIPATLKYSVGGLFWLMVMIYLATAGLFDKSGRENKT
jgi:uncharacterized membrane protein SpoIIM required for sporulation